MQQTRSKSRRDRMVAVAASVLWRGLVFGGLWAVLVGFRPEMLVFGAMVVPGALWLSLALMPPGQAGGDAVAPLRLVALLPAFLWGSLRGGVALGWLLVQPRLRINPGWTFVPVRARGAARVGYGAALSLMPGTLAAGTHRGRLLVHRLDRKRPALRGGPTGGRAR